MITLYFIGSICVMISGFAVVSYTISKISKRIVFLENPPKYKVGDKVNYCGEKLYVARVTPGIYEFGHYLYLCTKSDGSIVELNDYDIIYRT